MKLEYLLPGSAIIAYHESEERLGKSVPALTRSASFVLHYGVEFIPMWFATLAIQTQYERTMIISSAAILYLSRTCIAVLSTEETLKNLPQSDLENKIQ